jgi:thiol-disulfide isomerase/thioredoxin
MEFVMKFHRPAAVGLAALAWPLVAFSATLAQQPGKKEADPAAVLLGKKAPELVGVFAVNGRPVKLSEQRGKVVLVEFWAVWCVHCRALYPHLNAWHKELREDGLEVLGVTTYYQNLDFDKKAGKLVEVGKTVTNTSTGATEVVDGLEPARENEMLRAFTAHHKLRYRTMMLSKENYAKASKDYIVPSLPQAVLIDRLGNIRLVTSGVSEASIDALDVAIKKLIGEKE